MAINSPLNIALRNALTGTGYIYSYGDELMPAAEVTLDGEFTIKELEAIVALLKAHNQRERHEPGT